MLSRLKGKRPQTAPSSQGDDSPSRLSYENGIGSTNGSTRGVSPSPSPSSSPPKYRSAQSSTENLIDLTPSARRVSPNTSPSQTRRSTSTSTNSLKPAAARTLSSDRSSRGRSASFNTAANSPGDIRRSMNLSMPTDLGASPTKYLIVNGAGGGPGGGVGEGSLSFDLIGTTGDGRLTLVVDEGSPLQTDFVTEENTAKNSYSGSGTESDDPELKTPVPGSHPTSFNLPLHVANSVSSSAGEAPRGRPSTTGGSTANGAVSPSRPSSMMVRSGSSNSTNGNGPTPPISGRPRSQTNASVLSTSSLEPHAPTTTANSRPTSRSASINSQNNDFLSPTSTTSSRKSTLETMAKSFPLKKQRSNTGLSGIAGALALSGVALASPSSQLRQPMGLARVASGGSVNAMNATANGRDSMDDAVSDNGGSDAGGFVSMDQLGEFEDVVNQLGTGYAVASSKRNAEFHAIFKHIPEDDYLIEDYGCALQREILIQGRLYISEHHLSFNANIFGWVTTLTLPFAEVVSIEKRMTAFVIPNAIQVTTLHASHTFASFLSRDTTYDLIGSIWRMIHPLVPASAALPDHASHYSDDEGDHEGTSVAGSTDDHHEPPASAKKIPKKRLIGRRRRGDTGESKEGNSATVGGGGSGPSGGGNANRDGGTKASVHAVTTDTLPLLKNLKEVCMDTTFPSSPEKIYNLMFTSGYMRDFWAENQKLLELQIGDWAPEKSGSNLLARSMSYIKPLNGSIGPKQTKCMITDESAHVDFDDYVCIITSTRTPDVPSGSAFAVKTRTSMTWAKGNSCRVLVTTGVEWTKSSFIKGIIERSCIDGQKTYHADLEKSMRAYIHQHRSEFMEEGGSADSQSLAESNTTDDPSSTSPTDFSSSSAAADANKDKNAFEKIVDVCKPFVEAVSGLGDMFGGVSPMSAGLGFVIAVLVLSNLWTLSRKPSTSSRSPLAPTGSGSARNQRTPDEVATAVRSVLQDYFAGNPNPQRSPPELAIESAPLEELVGKEGVIREVEEIKSMLDSLEERLFRLRGALSELD